MRHKQKSVPWWKTRHTNNILLTMNISKKSVVWNCTRVELHCHQKWSNYYLLIFQSVTKHGKAWQNLSEFDKVWQKFNQVWQTMKSVSKFDKMWQTMKTVSKWGKVWQSVSNYEKCFKLWKAFQSVTKCSKPWKVFQTMKSVSKCDKCSKLRKVWQIITKFGKVWLTVQLFPTTRMIFSFWSSKRKSTRFGSTTSVSPTFWRRHHQRLLQRRHRQQVCRLERFLKCFSMAESWNSYRRL
jgi:hypothetical protein